MGLNYTKTEFNFHLNGVSFIDQPKLKELNGAIIQSAHGTG